MYRKFLKRIFDVLFSAAALIVLLPLMLIVSLLIAIDDHGPVFFLQERLGKNGEVFKMIKFRSMRVNSEHTGSGVYSEKNDPRVTAIGKIIRALSIDELPQMINILKGDMSFIGPRPPLTYHPWPIEKYTDEQKHMFDVRPGLTGWAQVNGRKTVEWHKRIEMSCYYAENISFTFDVKILFMTVGKIFRKEDNVNSGSTLEKSTGKMRLMYITNDVKLGQIAEEAGVDRIWIDLETVGKAERQGGLDTVQSKHTVDDIRKMKAALTKSELMVRINQIYSGTKEEIEQVIEAGADVIMLPYFKTAEQVKYFLSCVNGRAKTDLLFETVDSIENMDEILSLKGIDECHIGLNDLHLEQHRKFMFELLADGTVDRICEKFREHSIPYGFGGISRIGSGTLPAELILSEHKRLCSSAVILSRSFYRPGETANYDEARKAFTDGLRDFRQKENELETIGQKKHEENHKKVVEIIDGIVRGMK